MTPADLTQRMRAAISSGGTAHLNVDGLSSREKSALRKAGLAASDRSMAMATPHGRLPGRTFWHLTSAGRDLRDAIIAEDRAAMGTVECPVWVLRWVLDEVFAHYISANRSAVASAIETALESREVAP